MSVRWPGGHPALSSGPSRPRSAAWHAHRRVAARAEPSGPHQPGRRRPAAAAATQRPVPPALRLPVRAGCAPERPRRGAPGASPPATLPARVGAAHRPGRGEEDRPPAPGGFARRRSRRGGIAAGLGIRTPASRMRQGGDLALYILRRRLARAWKDNPLTHTKEVEN